MANTQAQFGFKHIGFISGAAPDYQLATRMVQSSFSTKIYFGDPCVKSAATGYITLPANSSAAPLEGIVQGFSYVPSGGGAPVNTPYFPGSTQSDATAYIINAPGALFLAAALLTAVPTAGLGNNHGFTTGGVTATTLGGGFSIYTLDSVTSTACGTTNSAYPFQLVSMYPGVGNGSDTTTSYNWVVVTFNNQRFKQLTGVT